MGGWREVIQPSLEQVKLWPFDGDISALVAEEGVTIAEIYPAEAYLHLGVKIGSGTGRTKTSREDRKEAAKHWSIEFSAGHIRLCAAAQSWVQWGFRSEDDFDAMAGLACQQPGVNRQPKCAPTHTGAGQGVGRRVSAP